MASASLLTIFLFLHFNSAIGDTCGGLLEGEHGHFGLPVASSIRDESGTQESSCLWIIQLHYKSNVRFTLDQLSEHSYLNLYPEDQLTACSASNYTKLNRTHVGSSLEFTGKTLIVILQSTAASVEFSWGFFSIEDDYYRTGIMKNSDYVISPSGLLEWQQLELEERVTWAIDPTDPFNMQWNVVVATPCDEVDHCSCICFAIFQLNSNGTLCEAMRTCGQSSEGKLERISGLVVVLIQVKTKVETNQIAVSWVPDNVTVIEPPVPTATGLFAATDAGLVALNLYTLEATALTSKRTLAVAVNHNLNKVYWSEVEGNCTIMRSNFDGSAEEIIVPPTGDNVYMLATEEATGNLYFALHASNEITVCNSLGKHCAAVITNSTLINYLHGIALDFENGFMYWTERGSVPNSIVRANMDGSNATLISTGFGNLVGITLGPTSNDILYWADFGDNTIGAISVNGENKRTLVELEGDPRPWGILVDAHNIYFSQYNGKNIQSVSRYSGKELTTVFNSTGGVRHLALFNAPVQ